VILVLGKIFQWQVISKTYKVLLAKRRVGKMVLSVLAV